MELEELLNMVRNTLGDLNNILFEQLERLNDVDIEGGETVAQLELQRSEKIVKVANAIINNGRLVKDVAKLSGSGEFVSTPLMLTGGASEK